MLARLLLALIVLLAAPAAVATPACHDAPPAMAGMAQHDPAPARAIPGELCIGCIAPATIHPPVLAARMLPAAPAPVIAASAAIFGTSPPPATPPPRRG